MACCESLQLDPQKIYETIVSYVVLVVSGNGGSNTRTVYDTKAKADKAIKAAFANGDTADISEEYSYVEVE